MVCCKLTDLVAYSKSFVAGGKEAWFAAFSHKAVTAHSKGSPAVLRPWSSARCLQRWRLARTGTLLTTSPIGDYPLLQS